MNLFSVHQVAPFHNNQFINGFTTSHSFKPATSPLTVRHYSPRNRFVSVASPSLMMENKRLLLEYIWGIRRKTNCWLIVTVVIFNSDDEKVWSQRNRKYVNVIYLNHLNRSWFLLFVAVALFCLTMKFRIWTRIPEYGSNRSYFWLTCPCFPAGITVNLTWGRPSPLRTAAQDFWTTRASFPASRPRGSTESAAVRRRDSPPASPEPGYPPPPPSHAGTPWARGA